MVGSGKSLGTYFLLLGISLVMGSGLNAQTVDTLTLKEAIRLSIANSHQLKAAAAKVSEASASLSEAKNNMLPDLKITGAYLRLNHANVDMKVPLGKEQQGQEPQGNGAPEITIDQAAYGMASLSLPLFSGGRITNGIKSAGFLKKAAMLDAENDRNKLIQNTIDAYYNLYKAQSAVSLVTENLKQAKQRAEDFANLERNGLLARNDLLKAQLQESNVALALLDATNNEKIANYNMNLMLGLAENTVLVLNSTTWDVPVEIKSVSAWEKIALANRADLLALEKRGEAASSGIKAAKGGYFPSIGLTGGYAAVYVPKVVTVTNALNVGVGIHYNLADLYKNGASVRKAEARQQQLYFTSLQLHDHIKIQIHQAFQNYIEQLKKIKVYEKAVEQAEENYRITKNKYDNALATTTDLLDADVSRLQANINYEYSKADAMIAYNKLYEIAGTLADRFPAE